MGDSILDNFFWFLGDPAALHPKFRCLFVFMFFLYLLFVRLERKDTAICLAKKTDEG